MTKQEKIKLLESLGSGTQNNIWVEIGSRTWITNIDFDNKEVVETSHFTASCGCCTESDWETIKFSDLDEDTLDEIIEKEKQEFISRYLRATTTAQLRVMAKMRDSINSH